MLGFMFAHHLSTVKSTVIELDILTGAVDIEILLNKKKQLYLGQHLFRRSTSES